MRVLVTGAAGFIGARLVEVLLEGGHAVEGVDILDGEDPPGWQQARLDAVGDQGSFHFVRADVTDAPLMEKVIREFRPEAVVHLASRRDLAWAEEVPEACLRLHVEGTAAILGACKRMNTTHVVVASSSHVYGGSRQYPFKESEPANRPLSVLGAAQRAAELTAHAMSLRSPVNTSVIRLFSVYGPGQSPRRLVPALADAAERRAPMPILGDGTAGRDLIHVDDVVVGILRVLDRPAPWRILNLGSGETTTLAQVAEQMSWIADVEFKRRSMPQRPGEIPHTYADIEAAGQAIGFVPAVGLEDGLRTYWEWFQNRPREFRTGRGTRS